MKKVTDILDIPESDKKAKKDSEALKKQKLENLRIGREKSLAIRKQKAELKKQAEEELKNNVKTIVKEKMVASKPPKQNNIELEIKKDISKRPDNSHNELFMKKFQEIDNYLNQWKGVSSQLENFMSKMNTVQKPVQQPVQPPIVKPVEVKSQPIQQQQNIKPLDVKMPQQIQTHHQVIQKPIEKPPYKPRVQCKRLDF